MVFKMIKFDPENEPIMPIEFSKEEFRTFLEVLEIADWVLNSHHGETPEEHAKYSEFEQKIFSQAEEFGFGDIVEYVEDHEEYFPTKKHDDNSNVMPIIKEFEEDSFWEEIAERMAKRDMFRELGEEKIMSMTHEEQFTAFHDYHEKYMDEFEEHDLDRLEVKE